MKLKKIHIDIANAICNKQLTDWDYQEESCTTCPFFLKEGSEICGKTIIQLLNDCGNKEIDLKEWRKKYEIKN